ncbi:MAG: hypothetical protein RIC95_04695 [Vicingaceae bacterium]
MSKARHYTGSFLTLFFTFIFSVIAQPEKINVYYPDDTLEFDLIYKDLDSLKNGELKAYFKEKPYQVAYEKHYYYGKQSGIYKEFYPSGRLMILAIYQAGKMHGDWTYYGPDGLVRQKAKYRNGKRHGFYINRVKHFQGRYKNGKKHGKWEYNVGTAAYRKVFYEEGKLTSKPTVFEKMKDLVDLNSKDSSQSVDGERKEVPYRKFDTLMLPVIGEDILKSYPVRYVSPDSMDHPTLQKAVFMENQNQTAVVKYIYQGKLNGLYKIYYPNGNIFRYAHYDYGKLDGDWKEYSPDGSLRIRGKYREGKKHGKWMINIGTESYRKEKYKQGKLK